MKSYLPFWGVGFFFLLGGLLLLARLDTYALWDDEAGTALHGIAVYQTGDTGALVGNNLVAFRNGVALKGLKDRTVSPLQYYFCAPFIGIWQTSSFWARLPFALAGILSFLLLAFWIFSSESAPTEKTVYCLGFLLCAPLFLYFRQCRYYSLVLFFEILALYLYFHKKRPLLRLILLNISIFGLLASNYLAGFALIGVLAIDYLGWGRKENPFPLKMIYFSGLFQIICGALLLSIWNPFGTGWGAYIHERGLTFAQRGQLLLWHFRDCFRAEFLGFLPCLLAMYLCVRRRDRLLMRSLVAVGVIVLLTTIVSPQVGLETTGTADIRYVISIIPLGVFIGARVVVVLAQKRLLWLIAGIFLFQFTNLVNPFRIDRGQGPSTIIGFIRELFSPVGNPYRMTADWISINVPKQASVWVLPDYACYPLMFHAPGAIYAWQLLPEQKQEEQFKNLPDIHFKGLVPPDFIVVFGPSVEQVRQLMSQWSLQGLRYQEVTRLMTFWKDLYRPELFWRTFKPIENFDPNTEAIYIFQRQS